MLENIFYSTEIVAPVFIVMALGYFAKKVKIINEVFVEVTSKFVFNISLPVLIFMEISAIDISETIDFNEIIFIYGATIITYLLVWVGSIPFIKDPKDRSVFIQGSYRGNYAIIGLALIANLFGEQELGKASIILAFVLPLYNILAVIVLTVPMRKEKEQNILKIIKQIAVNPLIIAVVAAVPFSLLEIKIPSLLETTGNYIGDIALPLALIGIGGSLNFDHLKKVSMMAFTAAALKLTILPLVMTFAAYFFGFRANELGVLYILFSCPTAIVSFIMADAMGTNSKLAGNIILVSTLGSVFTIALGITILKSFALI